jgi:alpha-ribazole phosphatase
VNDRDGNYSCRSRGTGFAGPQAQRPPRAAESYTKRTNVGAPSMWLVRHAQPVIEPGVCYGQLDVPADAEATAACARALAKALPQGIDILCSPLQRCEQLAHVLCGLRADLTCKTDPRLQEMDFGKWEGQRWDDIGAAALDAWVADFARHRPGDGESVHTFMQRVAEVWDERAAADTVWITHAGVIRAATLLQAGRRQLDSASQWPAEAPAYGSWRVQTRG